MSRSSHDGLFSDFELRHYIGSKISEAENEAKYLPLETFEANSDDQIIDHIVSKYLISPLAIRDDEKETDFGETSVDARRYRDRMIFRDEYDNGPIPIPAYRVTWKIPVSGTIELFNSRPSSYILTTFPGEMIAGSKLLLTTELPADSADEELIQNTLNGNLINIKSMVQNINNELSGYKENLLGAVTGAIGRRKQELDKIQKLKSALKVNIETREMANPLNQIKIDLHPISPLSTKKEDPGACITDGQYESILKAIRNMGASMETSRASESKDEEALRDTMLVGLNASMSSGTAGAELFRKKGKTDISILFENKAAFIAECKLWKGEQYILDGVDQLLGYLTWRDAKTSMIIFNRQNKNFSAIQDQVETVYLKHPSFVKKCSTQGGEWRFVFKKPDDDNKLITVHVFLFDVFEKENI